jgi:polysaccharide biosynthesis protein PslH
MRVLFVAPYVPSPIRVRPYQWIRALAANGCRVHLVALQAPEDRAIADPGMARGAPRPSSFP